MAYSFPAIRNEYLSEVGIISPVSFLVGIDQRASGVFASNACMIEFVLQDTEAGFDVVQAFPIGQLSKHHSEELIET